MNMYKIESEIDLDELSHYIAEDLNGVLVENSFEIGGESDGFSIATVDEETGSTCYWCGNVDDLSKYKIDLMLETAPALEFETIYTVEGLKVTQELDS